MNHQQPHITVPSHPRTENDLLIVNPPNGTIPHLQKHHIAYTFLPEGITVSVLPQHIPALRQLVVQHKISINDSALAILKRQADNHTRQTHQTPIPPEPQNQENTVSQNTSMYTNPINFGGALLELKKIPLTVLDTVSEKRKTKFETVGITNLYTLLTYVPRKYIDRSSPTLTNQLRENVDTGIVGQVNNVTVDSRRRMCRISVRDKAGTITATYFNAVWQAKRFKKGDWVIMYGKPEKYGSRWSMVNPILDPYEDRTMPVIPIYPQSGKNAVTTWEIRRSVNETLQRVALGNNLLDPLPERFLEEYNLMGRWEAFHAIHFPQTLAEVEPARKRIAFDELFRMQTAVLLTKNTVAEEKGVPISGKRPTLYTKTFISNLPYPLTNAQNKAIETIEKDITSGHPMHRLLQGDVGSGKTTVALWSILAGVEAGYQTALMAPTDILAQQLYQEIKTAAEKLPEVNGKKLSVQYFSNQLRGKNRDQVLQDLADGNINIAVGTHALIVDDVTFQNLGLVVIDEQHRFGVEQRAALRNKTAEGVRPHTLIMTATPIPRTSAMTVFGDLDLTVIDELPPGRTPIATSWINTEPSLTDLASPWDQVVKHVKEGRQVYVVCPLVTESEKLQATSAEETFEALRHGPLHDLKVGLVHGQQKTADRDEIMKSFRDGKLDVIVATTVIEVGVNVPNATMIVILDAPRFGISQLHQLRGRVGRGKHASECVLVGYAKTPDSKSRMKALVEYTDGFKLAEIDLEIRSYGTIFGSKQSGDSDLIVADLDKDKQILLDAHTAAADLLREDPYLDRNQQLKSDIWDALDADRRAWLGKA